MRRVLVEALVCGGVLLGGCSQEPQLGATEKGALAGGALGAGLGAIVGNQFGSPGAGVAIGSAFGALSGGAIGHSIDSQDAALRDREMRINQQQREIEENQRLIDELRKSGADVTATKRGIAVNLPDVLFNFGSASLTPEARRTVSKIATVAAKSGRLVSVEGHTDSVGSAEFNQRLSRDRAEEVASHLTSGGVARKRITARGFGASRPIASNGSAEGRRRNRRVEVIIEK